MKKIKTLINLLYEHNVRADESIEVLADIIMTELNKECLNCRHFGGIVSDRYYCRHHDYTYDDSEPCDYWDIQIDELWDLE